MISTNDDITASAADVEIEEFIDPVTESHDERELAVHSTHPQLKGLDHIRQELDQVIASLRDALHAHPVGSALPQNTHCAHKGKVFAIGIMKTGTTSMSAALSNLGYRCYGQSCLHVGHWDTFIDAVHLWQPFEVIMLSILKVPALRDMYLRDSFHALTFGDSPWCFMYYVFDQLYPGSKFILTQRKDDVAYINSYLKYITGYKKQYIIQGLTTQMFSSLAIRRYHLHNKMAQEYFQNRSQDLLTLTIDGQTDQEIMQKLSEFLGCKAGRKRFPRKNRAGARGRRVNVDQRALDWRTVFNVSSDDDYSRIPFITRDEASRDQFVHVVDKDEFVMDWDVFLIGELKGKLDTVLTS